MKRPDVTQIVIDEFSKLLDKQDEKGFEKYNKTIDEAIFDEDMQPYNWELMALEETADLQKYLVKRIIELRTQNEQLKEDNVQLLLWKTKVLQNHECLKNSKTFFEHDEPIEIACAVCGKTLHSYRG